MNRRFDEIIRTDVIVIGSGVAGLSTALAFGSKVRVSVVTKGDFGFGGSSPFAQGGIAVAMGADDSPLLHAEDTMAASAGLAVRDVVDVLTQAGPGQIERLRSFGAIFDLSPSGELLLGQEAAHRRRRILHARGDSTGAEVIRAMVHEVNSAPHIVVCQREFAVELCVDGGRVVGVSTVDSRGRTHLHLAPAVVLATGGVGQLYRCTTNPSEVTGDGLAMAIRAGARVADVEFVQFHPTAMVGGRDPMPLLTEALRGEGAVLRNASGRRFMADYHEDLELAPRDVVARAIWKEISDTGQVFLDAIEAVGDSFPTRFPTVWGFCQEGGLDPRKEWISVSPAAHFHMGGIDVNDDGRTSLDGLWACGEVSATGAHGANRLASNSLLEGLVFGVRVAQDISSRDTAESTASFEATETLQYTHTARERMARRAFRQLMWNDVGLVRSEDRLRVAIELIEQLKTRLSEGSGELANMLLVGHVIALAALARQESRGGHYRTDFPEPRDEYKHRQRFVAPEIDGPNLDSELEVVRKAELAL